MQVGFTIWVSFPDILETLLAQGPLEIKEKRLIQGKSIKATSGKVHSCQINSVTEGVTVTVLKIFP